MTEDDQKQFSFTKYELADLSYALGVAGGFIYKEHAGDETFQRLLRLQNKLTGSGYFPIPMRPIYDNTRDYTDQNQTGAPFPLPTMPRPAGPDRYFAIARRISKTPAGYIFKPDEFAIGDTLYKVEAIQR